MIMLKNVSYLWEDGEIALNNINLEIKKGEFILISGKSGSGKSTLGSVMNGLIPHYHNGKIQGEVHVECVGLIVKE
ncbi:ATP-binding cassette domain-containing protein [Fusobacterium animalis]